MISSDFTVNMPSTPTRHIPGMRRIAGEVSVTQELLDSHREKEWPGRLEDVRIDRNLLSADPFELESLLHRNREDVVKLISHENCNSAATVFDLWKMYEKTRYPSSSEIEIVIL